MICECCGRDVSLAVTVQVKGVTHDKHRILKAILFSFVLIVLVWPNLAHSLDRCIEYQQDVRLNHIRYFGLNYPWHYGIGQLKQESACRDQVTAFDKGMGPAQFMPATVKEVERLMGEKLDPYRRSDALRMQAFYMSRIHKQNWTGSLFITYQGYNGGFTLLRKESVRAGNSNWEDMRKQCNRRIITLKNGRKLDLCEVNYDYPQKVYKYGQRYKVGGDLMKFW